MSVEAPEPALTRLRAFFFGRDVFISYCYIDSAYAEALAVQLQQRKFSVFLGAWGASPGNELSPKVIAAARQSRMLVVVATPEARASKAVEAEIAYFAGDDHRQPVIPIDLGLNIRDTKTDWPAITGTDVVRESPDFDPQRPVPSAHVLDRVVNAARFTRQTTRLVRFLAGVFATVTLLIVGSVLWSRSIVHNAEVRALQAGIDAEARTSAANLLGLDAMWTSGRARGQMKIADSKQVIASHHAEREAAILASTRAADEAVSLLDTHRPLCGM